MTPERIAELRGDIDAAGYLDRIEAEELLDAYELAVKQRDEARNLFMDEQKRKRAAQSAADRRRNERDCYREALERIANDGDGRGMGGGIRRDGADLRDLARKALGEGER